MLHLLLLTFPLTFSLTLPLTAAPLSVPPVAPLWVPPLGARAAGFAGPAWPPAHPADSVGRVVQGGKTYVKHKVARGDSFYAIARRYGVPMDQVVAANPKVKNALSIGQVVLVPRSVAVLAAPDKGGKAADKPDKPDRAEKNPVPATPAGRPESGSASAPAAGARAHIVTAGQTLSTIARKHHVSVADLRRWNQLKNDNLRLKQRLVVSAAPVAAPVAMLKPERPEAAPRDEVKPVAPVVPVVPVTEAKKEDIREENTRAETPRRPAADTPDDTTAGTEVAESLRKITENGMAETIEASGESTKFLALHRTAAVGSLLQVKNPQNGQSVYVRVIGKLPPTGANENVIIRLSRRAVQKLQVVDARFRVEVSYMP